MPARRYSIPGEDGSENVLEISFGKVSVVHIARAAASQCSCEAPNASNAAGILFSIFWIGSLRIDISHIILLQQKQPFLTSGQ